MDPEVSPEEHAYRAGLRLLGYRFRSVEELRRKLAEKGFAPADVTAALERLTAEGWMDDSRFAQEMARSKGKKGHGPKRVALELRQFGIADDLARAAIRSAAEESGGTGLEELVRKRVRILSRRHGAAWIREREGRKKLLAYLLQQGYEYAAVTEAVAAVLQKESE